MPRDFARRPSVSCTLEAVSFSARSNREMMACSASIAASLRMRSNNNARWAPHAREFGAGSSSHSLLVLLLTFFLVTTDLPQRPRQLSSCVKLLQKCMLLARDVRRSDEDRRKACLSCQQLRASSSASLPQRGRAERASAVHAWSPVGLRRTAVTVCKKPTCTVFADGGRGS